MGHYKVNPKDIFFILRDQLNYGSLCVLDRYKGLNEKTLDLLVSEAIRFAKGVVDPLQEIGERWGVKHENGTVLCPPEFKTAFRRFGVPSHRFHISEKASFTSCKFLNAPMISLLNL